MVAAAAAGPDAQGQTAAAVNFPLRPLWFLPLPARNCLKRFVVHECEPAPSRVTAVAQMETETAEWWYLRRGREGEGSEG